MFLQVRLRGGVERVLDPAHHFKSAGHRIAAGQVCVSGRHDRPNRPCRQSRAGYLRDGTAPPTSPPGTKRPPPSPGRWGALGSCWGSAVRMEGIPRARPEDHTTGDVTAPDCNGERPPPVLHSTRAPTGSNSTPHGTALPVTHRTDPSTTSKQNSETPTVRRRWGLSGERHTTGETRRRDLSALNLSRTQVARSTPAPILGPHVASSGSVIAQTTSLPVASHRWEL